MSNHDIENHMQTEAKWHELKLAREKLLSGDALKNIGLEVFDDEKECACCMDERVGNRQTLGHEEVGNRWNVAGSGILLPEQSWRERAKLAAKEAFRRGVTKITFHDGCGAAGLAVKQDFDQFSEGEKKLYSENSDLFGQEFSKLAQSELNKLTGQDFEAIRVGEDEVQPFAYHAAVGATIDTTGEFNAFRLPKEHPLKYSFNIDSTSGDTLKSNEEAKFKYYLNELLVALKIATGHHGFGNKFKKDDPFAVVIVGSDDHIIEKTEKKIKEFLQTSEPSFLKIIKFVHFQKPEQTKRTAIQEKKEANI